MDGIELHATIRALSNPRVVVRRIVEETLSLIPAADGSVLMLFSEGELRFECAAGSLGQHVGLTIDPSGSLAGLSVRVGSTLRCDDSESDPRVDHEASHRVGARSIVCVPLKWGEKPIGVFSVTSAQTGAFSDRDVATLAGLSSFVGATVIAAAQIDLFAGEPKSWRFSEGVEAGRDLAGMSAFVANVLEPGVVADLRSARRIQRVLTDQSFYIVHQPIVELVSGRVVISEALARFTIEPWVRPAQWFEDAWRAGLGPELELAAASAALDELHRLPADCRLAINVSSSVVERDELASILAGVALNRVVLEITEHLDAQDFARTRRLLGPLRRSGAQLAMDDTGTGFSGLSRMIELAPEIIKLDRCIIEGIDIDPVRRSLATSIVAFARDVTAAVVAEGVETEAQLDVIRSLGISHAQGYLIGRPGPVETLGHSLDCTVDHSA